jgi:hypothetical protein
MENIEISECPTVRPTKKEFSNFIEYMEKLEKEYGNEFGMVKVNNFSIKKRLFLLRDTNQGPKIMRPHLMIP